MATDAQILANRENARLSTGPRTPEGKARAARNSRSHGLTAETLSIAPHEREDFDAFRAGLLSDTRAEGALEEEYFTRLLAHGWNLRKVRSLESRLLAETDPIADEAAAAKLLRFARYRRELERSYDRALSELRKLQTQRAALLQQPDRVIEAIYKATPLAELTRITSQTDPFIREAGDPFPLDSSAQFAKDRASAVKRSEKGADFLDN